MTLESSKKGFTGFQIKFLALIFMLLDHIHYFFEFTGKVPVIFSWIGRLAGGLFLFTMIEGYTHTSNKKKYFTRIYLMSASMGLIKYIIQISPQLQRGDGFYPENSIFSTFVILIIIFKGIDYIREKKLFKGIGLILLPFITSYSFNLLPKAIMPYAYILASTLIPSPFLVEGGLYVIITGVILYSFRENRKLQGTIYGIFVLAWMVGLPLIYIRPISLKLMFTDYYEWMSVFALIFMFLYNGEKGKSMKRLFYIFYPAHIYILYILSFLLYKFKY
ncbi:conjugal transfer protein TraX [Tissierella sp. MSJ-40]|uniref:Conjugal transfer protein TraX n=1 Tax=Tissierella simiarum TaxID=2841534 RepID=A0ABS6E558_9FIRM|nr:TraX family protein [Tissierella simiarum]MBU5438059.1 conjugal transfer protein TraX [Tissierella simiarum]